MNGESNNDRNRINDSSNNNNNNSRSTTSLLTLNIRAFWQTVKSKDRHRLCFRFQVYFK